MRAARGEEGSALVEFVVLGVLLMVPLVYVMLGVFDVQRAAFGVTEAARQAGRTYVTSGCDTGRAEQAADLAMRDQGVTEGVSLDVGTCPEAGGRTRVTVACTVQLPGLGALFPARRGGVQVRGQFVAVRDRFAP